MKSKLLRVAASLLALVLALSVSAFAVSYSDTSGHWGEKAIKEWSDYGIVQGSDGKFRPNDPITRAELAKILSYTLKLEKAAANTFIDLPNAWYTADVLKCVAAGIMQGDGNGTIRPTAPITREEAFVMVGRALKIEQDTNPDLTKFTDGSSVSTWARGYISQLVALGYIQGVGANQMQPKTNINRASVVTILSNAIAQYVYKDGTAVTLSGNDSGIVLVVAKNVRISGTAKGPMLIGQGAKGGSITLAGIVGKAEVAADDVTINTENAQILNIVFKGQGGKLKMDSSSVVVKTEGTFEKIAPQTPVVPSTPTQPDTPTIPDEPDTPDTPDEPDIPDTPPVPETPEIPITPSNPGGGLIEDGGGLWTPLG
ncbi:MAG: S-layer homology domain-containing protein [Clostridia bacterium]|nr:S-layer homology domain-containing protein [Clostridia bacterium]